MGLSLVTAPASEPLTTAEAKAHLRVDISDDDTLIDNCIAAARWHVESVTRRGLVSQTWDYTLPRFPFAEGDYPEGPIRLPKQPVTSVSYVQYVNGSGSTVSYADTSTSPETPYWTLIDDSPYSLIIPNYNLTWPETREHGNAVTVRFVVGYTTLPKDIRQALLMLVAHFYEMREPVVVGLSVSSVPLAVEALLSPYILRGF